MPASPYDPMAGTLIATALVLGSKSDLPGDVIGAAKHRYLVIRKR
jgi:type IV secretory pathway VirB10-like protein